MTRLELNYWGYFPAEGILGFAATKQKVSPSVAVFGHSGGSESYFGRRKSFCQKFPLLADYYFETLPTGHETLVCLANYVITRRLPDIKKLKY